MSLPFRLEDDRKENEKKEEKYCSNLWLKQQQRVDMEPSKTPLISVSCSDKHSSLLTLRGHFPPQNTADSEAAAVLRKKLLHILQLANVPRGSNHHNDHTPCNPFFFSLFFPFEKRTGLQGLAMCQLTSPHTCSQSCSEECRQRGLKQKYLKQLKWKVNKFWHYFRHISNPVAQPAFVSKCLH